ncbi:hypothetical protein EIN_056270 [Entamoeba invadens IP1]|uniref:hypothetical protein n=1 Tax=Entamoeba invadens IP1 TaxID=370355 RepID=UPI0002C3E74D|nr:hypothetical protein EIN_056270 [Entamoeba invadens IP1]ELP93252.1 hypothetical protein EIN_056270 [Entamoeba invadens IP1]|eukprot:XP_004260023.1 hypothetical protein EIN_056270 [Entamoeba invadens IP1]
MELENSTIFKIWRFSDSATMTVSFEKHFFYILNLNNRERVSAYLDTRPYNLEASRGTSYCDGLFCSIDESGAYFFSNVKNEIVYKGHFCLPALHDPYNKGLPHFTDVKFITNTIVGVSTDTGAVMLLDVKNFDDLALFATYDVEPNPIIAFDYDVCSQVLYTLDNNGYFLASLCCSDSPNIRSYLIKTNINGFFDTIIKTVKIVKAFLGCYLIINGTILEISLDSTTPYKYKMTDVIDIKPLKGTFYAITLNGLAYCTRKKIDQCYYITEKLPESTVFFRNGIFFQPTQDPTSASFGEFPSMPQPPNDETQDYFDINTTRGTLFDGKSVAAMSYITDYNVVAISKEGDVIRCPLKKNLHGLDQFKTDGHYKVNVAPAGRITVDTTEAYSILSGGHDVFLFRNDTFEVIKCAYNVELNKRGEVTCVSCRGDDKKFSFGTTNGCVCCFELDGPTKVMFKMAHPVVAVGFNGNAVIAIDEQGVVQTTDFARALNLKVQSCQFSRGKMLITIEHNVFVVQISDFSVLAQCFVEGVIDARFSGCTEYVIAVSLERCSVFRTKGLKEVFTYFGLEEKIKYSYILSFESLAVSHFSLLRFTVIFAEQFFVTIDPKNLKQLEGNLE